jgi:hypothetical protein
MLGTISPRFQNGFQVRLKWSNAGPGGQQVEELLERIQTLKDAGVTGGSVVFSWMYRRVQPLQKRAHPGFLYQGYSMMWRSCHLFQNGSST